MGDSITTESLIVSQLCSALRPGLGSLSHRVSYWPAQAPCLAPTSLGAWTTCPNFPHKKLLAENSPGNKTCSLQAANISHPNTTHSDTHAPFHLQTVTIIKMAEQLILKGTLEGHVSSSAAPLLNCSCGRDEVGISLTLFASNRMAGSPAWPLRWRTPTCSSRAPATRPSSSGISLGTRPSMATPRGLFADTLTSSRTA